MIQLTVIRGAPGSGKSTLARAIELDLSAGETPVAIVEMDDWRINGKVYTYDQTQNTRIADECFQKVRSLLEGGVSVIVANTFIRRLHVSQYRRLAKSLRVPYQEYICRGEFRSLHGVEPGHASVMHRQMEL